MYKIIFFVPESHKQVVKKAIFQAGAGNIGNYDSCSWEVKGAGQFRALDGSNPFIGKKDAIEKIDEFRVETVCNDINLKAVVSALKKSHPYETPAYDIIKTIDI